MDLFASALLSVTRRMIYLENGDVGRLTREAIELIDGQGQPVAREVATSSLSADAVGPPRAGQHRYSRSKLRSHSGVSYSHHGPSNG